MAKAKVKANAKGKYKCKGKTGKAYASTAFVQAAASIFGLVVDLVESASAFADIQATSDISLEDLKRDIPEIEGTADVQIATKKVTDIGFRLIDIVAKYAQVLMQLAERQDELEVATQDLDRATNQVIFN